MKWVKCLGCGAEIPAASNEEIEHWAACDVCGAHNWEVELKDPVREKNIKELVQGLHTKSFAKYHAYKALEASFIILVEILNTTGPDKELEDELTKVRDILYDWKKRGWRMGVKNKESESPFRRLKALLPNLLSGLFTSP